MSFVNRLRQSEGLAVVYRRVCNARYGRGWGGFHRDPIYRKLIEELIESLQPTAFVETGTYRGYSTEFVASRFPKLPIYTTEIVEDRYQLTKKQLNRYSNITAELGNSDAVVRKWVAERKPGALPLYFLDAHWETYWPLREELRCITGAGGKAVIVIDDFEVPGHAQFEFDLDGGAMHGEGAKCNLDYVSEALSPQNAYRSLFPRYTRQQAYGRTHDFDLMRGHVVLFQNATEELEKFRARPTIQQYYFEHDVPVRPGV